jgi:4-aminobutyrate aminotransferase-like enzyme
MNVFESLESEVRHYCRSWPVVFTSARGSWLHAEDDASYLDFFAGAGALNYDHNNPLKQALLDYIARDGAPLPHVTWLPYDGYFVDDDADLPRLHRLLGDRGSGLEEPAAIIVETVQGEGGLNAARPQWCREWRRCAGVTGSCWSWTTSRWAAGGTGPFFSFEQAGIEPEVVCLSKSISGYGLPLALTVPPGPRRVAAR